MSAVGQSDNPATAAGQAAKDAVMQSSWPPTRSDAGRIGGSTGAAAATAACVAYGAEAASPLCSEVGNIIGEYVGEAIYDLIDSLSGSQADRLTREAIQRHANERAAAGLLAQAAKSLAILHADRDPAWARQFAGPGGVLSVNGRIYTSWPMSRADNQELAALIRWGAPYPISAQSDMATWTKRLMAAEAARAAELTFATAQRGGSLPRRGAHDNSSSIPTPVLALGAAGGAWVLLKLLS